MMRRSLSAANVFLLLAVGITANADEVHTLPAVSTVVDGHGIYVDDAYVAREIPQFSTLGPRVDTCPIPFSMAAKIAYPPTVTALHRGFSNTLDCEGTPDASAYECRAHVRDRPVAFDVDPALYFEVDDQTPVDEALQVYRAFRDGRIRYADHRTPYFPSLRVRSIKREAEHLLLYIGGCGCGESIAIERAPPGIEAAFTGRTVRAICH